MAKEAGFPPNKVIIAVFLFALFYFVLYAWSSARDTIGNSLLGGLWVFALPDFISPMYFILPAVAFCIMFLLVDWVNGQFETKLALSPLFPAIFFFLSLAAFYIALFWYYSNFAQLAGQKEVVFDFAAQLRQSAFLLFMWGGVFGWVTRFAVEKINL
ncbi:MAG: hypothetical protein NTW59_03530 [Candidatus Diapherotrites archaeon]|nr:hypothetical protein [Candidatus Diapherotrites archaeon]